jgi:Uma2 family endonuclease
MINEINQLDLDKHYTYADYLTWQFKERVELIKGRIFKMSPAPGTNHQRLLTRLVNIMYSFFQQQRCELFAAPFDVRLHRPGQEINIDTVVQPDLCVICDSTKLDSKGCKGAPDLIAEIVSRSSRKKDLNDKFELYEQSGVREYWIIQPNDRTIQVFTLNESGKYILQRPDTYGGQVASRIFPGLTVSLEELFRNMMEEPEERYKEE